MLKDIMERAGGAYDWSKDHNSKFKTNKFTLLDFTLNRSKNCPTLILQGTTVPTSPSHKFLGVIVDQELRWQAHKAYALTKSAAYVKLLHCLSTMSWGLSPKFLRQLYQAVTLPHIAYVASIWFCPIYDMSTDNTKRGLQGFARKAESAQ
jgi:hypothetical protein